MTWWLDAESIMEDLWNDGSSREGLGEKGFELKRRAEASQTHAEYRIKNHKNKYDRIDAMLALKRSMQTRLDHLDSIYGFKQYPQTKNVGWLGLLEQWGVIRQRVLRRMSQLRNAVEHDGAEPPGIEECEDYSEVNWWFLRGTTPLLMPMQGMDFNGEEKNHLSIDFQYNPLSIRISGKVVQEALSDSPQHGWSIIKPAPAL